MRCDVASFPVPSLLRMIWKYTLTGPDGFCAPAGGAAARTASISAISSGVMSVVEHRARLDGSRLTAGSSESPPSIVPLLHAARARATVTRESTLGNLISLIFGWPPCHCDGKNSQSSRARVGIVRHLL